MATDPFDSVRVRLANHVTRRTSLGVFGLIGMANAALLDEADAKKKKRKKNRKNKKKGKGTTTLAPSTTSTTTLAPGTCGAAGSNCGTAQTACVCGAGPTDLENVRCVSLVGFTLDECLDDSECTDGKVCILDPASQITAVCLALCSL